MIVEQQSPQATKLHFKGTGTAYDDLVASGLWHQQRSVPLNVVDLWVNLFAGTIATEIKIHTIIDSLDTKSIVARALTGKVGTVDAATLSRPDVIAKMRV